MGNNYTGMTLKEFNDTVEVMRTIYPFEDDKTRICELYDLRTDRLNRVQIITEDERTNTQIVMSKDVERNFNERT